MTPSTIQQYKDVPIVVLCGGPGVMFDAPHSQRLNKGLLPVHGQPLFLWVLHHYALHGGVDFILATGLQSDQFGEALRSIGAAPDAGQSDRYNINIAGRTCSVRIVETAVNATTSARLLACHTWLAKAEHFALTYSDTLSDVNLGAEMAFHKTQGLVATLVGTPYSVRFRILGVRQDEALVRAFATRPIIESPVINGGYYIFNQGIWGDRYGISLKVAVEELPLERLVAAGQLAAFANKRRWQHCDAERDLGVLTELARSSVFQTAPGIQLSPSCE